MARDLTCDHTGGYQCVKKVVPNEAAVHDEAFKANENDQEQR
jgi:hypothetical protein